MTESQHSITSQLLKNQRTLWVIEPAQPTSAPNLLLILDAELYRQRVKVNKILDTLTSNGILKNTLIVQVASLDRETRFRECPCHAPFADFIAHELLPWIHQRFPGVQASDRRAIVGLSYTGLAASYTALKHEGLFTHVISQSGSYWSNDCWLTRNYENAPLSHPPAFYLDVGDQETQTNVQHTTNLLQTISQIEGVERFQAMLQKNGYTHRYDTFQGHHSAEDWARTLPNALKWVFS